MGRRSWHGRGSGIGRGQPDADRGGRSLADRRAPVGGRTMDRLILIAAVLVAALLATEAVALALNLLAAGKAR